jgi:UDP-N-acetylglucosamine acyltransferase
MKQDLYNSDWITIDGNSIHKTAIIHPNVVMGKGNVIGAYCVIGGNGEIRDKDQMDFSGTVHIGNNNVISEHVTIQRPFDNNKSTIICDDNIIMAHVHIGHDSWIGNRCEICTGTVVGGYVNVYDEAKIKLNCTIRNRVIIGVGSVVGMGSVVVRNVPNFGVVYGNPAKEKDAIISAKRKPHQMTKTDYYIISGILLFICVLLSVLIYFSES